MKPRHLLRGEYSEKFARKWLRRHGLRHVTSNWHCSAGELDLVMQDGDCLVIVEVRYRADCTRGGALESITTEKIRRICLAARHYLHTHQQYADSPLRFDVFAISGPSDNLRADWRRAAFSDDGDTF